VELISLKAMEGIFPKYAYKRIKVEHFWEYFSFKIDFSFGYLLRRLRIKYPSVIPAPRDVYTAWTNGANVAGGAWFIPSANYAGTKGYIIYTTLAGGITGGAEPAWPIQIGATVIDNTVTWIAVDPASVWCKQVNDIKIEIFDNANNFVRQPEPHVVELFSTPGKQNSFIRPAPQPYDQSGYGVNFSANAPLFSSTLNFLYRFGDIVWIKFSEFERVTQLNDPNGDPAQLTSPFWSPNYIDVFLEGYYTPEKAYEAWKGANV